MSSDTTGTLLSVVTEAIDWVFPRPGLYFSLLWAVCIR